MPFSYLPPPLSHTSNPPSHTSPPPPPSHTTHPSSVTLDVLCAPLTVGRVEQQFAVTFDNVENADKSVDEQVIYTTTHTPLMHPLTPSSLTTLPSHLYPISNNMGQGRYITKEQLFTCRVEVDELPIYPVYETLDIKTVLYGRVYRQHLHLCNRAKTGRWMNDEPIHCELYLYICVFDQRMSNEPQSVVHHHPLLPHHHH